MVSYRLELDGNGHILDVLSEEGRPGAQLGAGEHGLQAVTDHGQRGALASVALFAGLHDLLLQVGQQLLAQTALHHLPANRRHGWKRSHERNRSTHEVEK